MSSDAVISVENVSKKYCRSLKRSMLYGLQDIGANMLRQNSKPDRLRKDEFWATDKVSFEVKRGETLGLIGMNGSGKTTLLKMLSGIFWPDQGKITVRGRVGALIAVGAGFHPLLTGRENIFVNGAILGMGRSEMMRKFDAIVEFSGIKEFLDTPVKHYSSGMFVRLGFAIAIHCEPEILLVDEVLAVGDITFRSKCMDKMKELEKNGVTKVFVSHDMNSVFLLCDRAIYLSSGSIKHLGPTADVIGEYKKDMLLMQKKASESRSSLRVGGTGDVVIRGVEFLDRQGHRQGFFKRGEFFRARISFEIKDPLVKPNFTLSFFTDKDVLVSKEQTVLQGAHRVDFTVDKLPLNMGQYYVSVTCQDVEGDTVFDHHEKCYEFVVEEGLIQDKIRERWGLMYVPCDWAVHAI